MVRIKVEEVIEEEKELELKVEEVIEEEKIDQKDCTLEDILEIKDKKSTLENEIKSHELRIKNIGNELKVLNKDIENLEKINFTKELSEEESKKLETKKLEIVELNRQLKVKIDKIEECKKEVEEYDSVLKEFAITQYRKIVEKEIKLQDDRYEHIFEIKKSIDKIMQHEKDLIDEEKHIIELKQTLLNIVQIPDNIEIPVKSAPMQAGQRKEIVSKVRDLSLYLSKKVK
jgi:chromosome segregation ATPase